MSQAPAPAGAGASASSSLDRARRIEEASLRAWPALTDSDFDGWRLRFANGYTRRSNSVTPLGPSRLDLDDKIAACERIYGERGLPTIFRLTPFAPAELDPRLASRGYVRTEQVEVRARGLGPAGPPLYRAPRNPRAQALRVASLGLDRWLDVFTALSGATESTRPAHRQVLAAVQGKRRLLALMADVDSPSPSREGGRAVSCGMSVLQEGLLGLFDLVTDRAHRGRGFGGELLRRALEWGVRSGGEEAYLQVVDTNWNAARLYQRAGFELVYRYHYRERR